MRTPATTNFTTPIPSLDTKESPPLISSVVRAPVSTSNPSSPHILGNSLPELVFYWSRGWH
jgi:hypothetical protein